ncbi:MAG TPA: urea ABC transporter permease subunit UrtC [Stellaceae bacterium]|jgi:urea transport system permease protein|nr:urea ABC transporter permease subunit UrtC [Stellaceae bacterium]
MKANSNLMRGGWLVLVLLGIAAPWIISTYELNLLARFLALSILAVGLVLLWGEAGVLSLGQGVFFGLGGYCLAMNLKLATLDPGDLPDFMVWSGQDSLPWWWAPFAHGGVAILGVVVVPGVLAAVFSWLVFRRRIGGVYFALITQALALAFSTLLISQQASTGGFNGLTDYQTLLGFDLADTGVVHGLYWITLVLLIGVFAGVRWLLNSRYGKLLRATRDGENRVRFLGYDPTPYKVLAFTLSACLAGVAGALFTLHSGVVSPALVGVVPSIEMVIWVAVGGRLSLGGAVAGTLLVNFAKDRVSSAFPNAWLYLLGLLFVLVVTLLPDGLAGLARDIMKRFKAPDVASPKRPVEAEEVL